MSGTFFQNGAARVGQTDVEFTRRIIRDRFIMYAPASFSEDKNLISNYTYLFSKDNSPLSIAVKYAPAATEEEKDRQITHYFKQSMETRDSEQRRDGGIFYRETVTESKYLSVYSLRFSVEVKGGLLFGCFNSSADCREDWKPVVLAMLQSIEPV